mmetsp:Transcript_14941/g.22744  ORF Transcript_14941/g.22744 Transcript_14941/m.22744 type:complete len:243 (-) Transcript_14941:1195-1923(-)
MSAVMVENQIFCMYGSCICIKNSFFDCSELVLENINENWEQVFFCQWNASHLWIQSEMAFFANLSANENLASRHSNILVFHWVVFPCWCTHDSDICNLDLTTAIWASSPVDANWPIHRYQLFQFFADIFSICLRLNQCQTAEFCTCATDHISFNHSNIHPQPRIRSKAFFLEKFLDSPLRYIWKDSILFDCQSNFSSRVFVRQVSELSRLFHTQSTGWNMDSNTDFSSLRLLVDSSQFPSFV